MTPRNYAMARRLGTTVLDASFYDVDSLACDSLASMTYYIILHNGNYAYSDWIWASCNDTTCDVWKMSIWLAIYILLQNRNLMHSGWLIGNGYGTLHDVWKLSIWLATFQRGKCPITSTKFSLNKSAAVILHVSKVLSFHLSQVRSFFFCRAQGAFVMLSIVLVHYIVSTAPHHRKGKGNQC